MGRSIAISSSFSWDMEDSVSTCTGLNGTLHVIVPTAMSPRTPRKYLANAQRPMKREREENLGEMLPTENFVRIILACRRIHDQKDPKQIAKNGRGEEGAVMNAAH